MYCHKNIAWFERARPLLPLFLLLVGGCFFSCNLNEETGDTFMQISVDTTWAHFDSLEIAWKDTLTGQQGIFFQGDPAVLKNSNKVKAGDYKGQKIVVTVKGFKNKAEVYEDVRGYDGANPSATTKQVVKPFIATPPDSLPPDTSKHNPPDTLKPAMPGIALSKNAFTISINDSIQLSADVTLKEGSLKYRAWDWDGDGAFEDSSSASGGSQSFAGGFRYHQAGKFTVTFKTATTADSTARASATVTVLEDRPVAEAGDDTTVVTGAKIHLHGKARDGIGSIAKTEWQIGGGDFVTASTDTVFQAADHPLDLICVLRATDDDGLTQIDSLIVHVISASEANLTSLIPSMGTLTPQFNPTVFAYADTVPFDAASITITAGGVGDITLEGNPLASGQPSSSLPLKTGSNRFTLAVQLSGSPTKSYIVDVYRPAAATNADLASLSLSAGALNPVFSSGDTTYQLTMPNGTASTTVTATTADAAARLSINGQAASGTVSVNLAVGTHPIPIVVTAQAGNRKTYTVFVTRSGNANTLLATLFVSPGTLIPGFFPSTHKYSLTVEDQDSIVTIAATPAAATSTLTVDKQNASPGVSVPVRLITGANTVSVAVKAQDGSSDTYEINVTRKGNGNATLSDLSLSAGTIPKPFDPAMAFYSFSVPNSVASTSVTAVTANAASTLTIAGDSAASGTARNVALKVGTNVIEVVVTSQAGPQMKYSIQIIRAANGDANLASLAASAGPLDRDFDPSQTSYSVTVGNEVLSTTVTAVAAAATSADTVNGKAVASGSASQSIPLKVGQTPIDISVTAENGTNKHYLVTVTRAASGNNDLASLSLSTGAMDQAFSPSRTLYTDTVPNSTVSAVVSASVADTTATAAFYPGANVNLTTGLNVIKVEVTAQNSVKKTYTIQLYRLKNGDASLSNLAASAGPLSPAFTQNGFHYSISVSNAVSTTTITPTVSAATSKVAVNKVAQASGTASPSIPLKVGTDSVVVDVTAEDGSVSTYVISITRAVSIDATLKDLSISAVPAAGSPVSMVLYPPFASNAQDFYTAPTNSPASVQVLATANQGTDATITINGQTVASGTPSASIPVIATGATPITIEVTAPDKTTKRTYTVQVARSKDVGYTGGYRLFKTYDAGSSWINLSSSVPSFQSFNALYFTDANTGYGTGAPGTIFKTVDGGQTWTKKMVVTPNTNSTIIFTSPSTGFVFGTRFIMKTTDAGETWQNKLTDTTVNVRSAFFTSPTTGFAFGYSDFLLKTTDGGETWNKITFGYNWAFFGGYFTDANTGYLVASSGLILKTVNGAASWTQSSYGLNFWLYDVEFTDANTGFAVGYDRGILKTTNAGGTWTQKLANGTGTLNAVSFLDANTGFAVGDNAMVFKTTNGGENWTQQPALGDYGLESLFFLKQ